MTTIPKNPKRVLFVCLGNICRSPSAESVMRHKCERVGLDICLDSAGTAGFHSDELPDSRAIQVGAKRGYDLTKLRARQVEMADFYQFALILAMDDNNLKDLSRLRAKAVLDADGRTVADLQLFDPTGKTVADPYYGDEQDFETMYAHLEQVADAYIRRWSAQA